MRKLVYFDKQLMQIAKGHVLTPNGTRRGQLPRSATKGPPSISVHGLPLKYSCSDFAFFPSSFWVICGAATT